MVSFDHMLGAFLMASNAGEALAISDAHPDRIHAVLTDAVMPGMSGPKLAHAVKERRADVRVILTSGYTVDALREEGIADIDNYLQKPYDLATLARTIRESLDAPAT